MILIMIRIMIMIRITFMIRIRITVMIMIRIRIMIMIIMTTVANLLLFNLMIVDVAFLWFCVPLISRLTSISPRVVHGSRFFWPDPRLPTKSPNRPDPPPHPPPPPPPPPYVLGFMSLKFKLYNCRMNSEETGKKYFSSGLVMFPASLGWKSISCVLSRPWSRGNKRLQTSDVSKVHSRFNSSKPNQFLSCEGQADQPEFQTRPRPDPMYTSSILLIPNTAVFGPTDLIGTIAMILYIQKYFRRCVTLGRPPCHKVSHSATPPPRERYVIVERPLIIMITILILIMITVIIMIMIMIMMITVTNTEITSLTLIDPDNRTYIYVLAAILDAILNFELRLQVRDTHLQFLKIARQLKKMRQSHLLIIKTAKGDTFWTCGPGLNLGSDKFRSCFSDIFKQHRVTRVVAKTIV